MSINVLPPGESPIDPYIKDIDPVGYALRRVEVHLSWIDEHLGSYELARESDAEEAIREMDNLKDSIKQGKMYMQRLKELLLAGYTMDPTKRMPSGLERNDTRV